MTKQELNPLLQRRLTELTECFDAPCVVNAPQIGQDLLGRNVNVTAFTDEAEYAGLPGFRRWSISQPVYLADEFDFVLMFACERRGVEVFSALRVLTHFHYDTPVVVVAPKAGAARLLTALKRFEMTEHELFDDTVLLANFELP